MLLHEAVARCLVQHGIDTMFGLIGDGNLFLADSYVRRAGGRYVGSTHEANAVHMAHGFAVISGRVGAATVTHGPGLTNSITALVEATKAAAPLLLVTGDTNTLDRYGPQVVAQRELVSATGAGFQQVRAAETALEDLTEALRRARTESRPVVLNLPVEFTHREIEYAEHAVHLPAPGVPVLDEDQLDVAVGILAAAQRPLLLAGRGARAAAPQLSALAERVGAPVATTLGGKDLFRGDPGNLGIFGTLATPAALDAITQSDCVIAFGAGLNRFTTVSGDLLSGRTVIHCDTVASRIGRFSPVDAPVVGDAAEVADTVIAWLDKADLPRSSFRDKVVAAGPYDRAEAETAAAEPDARVDVRTALRAVDEAMDAGRTLVTDAGRYLAVAWPEVHVEHPDHFLFTVNYGAIGTGVGSAIGAAVARPEHPTLLICGDGGLMLGGLAELSTASRLGLDLVVVVCNDGAYGAEYVQFTDRGLSPELSEFSWPSFAAAAQVLGMDGVTVASAQDLPAALERIRTRSRTRPLLVDVLLDPARMPDVAH